MKLGGIITLGGLLLALVPAVAFAAPVHAPILMYHEVIQPGPGSTFMQQHISISPKKLEVQLKYIVQHGYHPVFMSEVAESLRDGTTLPHKPVALTFDDGTSDFADVALPLITKYKIKVTIYVNPGYDGTNERMTLATLRKVATNPYVEVGSHTFMHTNLTQLSSTDAASEVIASKKFLEDLLHKPVKTFAYPFGTRNEGVVQLVKQAGYEGAVIADTSSKYSEDTIMTLPRYNIGEADPMSTFTRLLRSHP